MANLILILRYNLDFLSSSKTYGAFVLFFKTPLYLVISRFQWLISKVEG